MKILFLMGVKSFTVNPHNEEDLGGGAEKAVIRLAQNLAVLGQHVIVCGPVITTKHQNVMYVHFSELERGLNFVCDALIMWRENGLNFYLQNKSLFKHGSLYYDCHDFLNAALPLPAELTLNGIFLKSKFHHQTNQAFLGNVKSIIIPNGVETEMINQIRTTTSAQRLPHRMCHATSLDRGILEVLRDVWPKVKATVSDAELHIYYGRLDFGGMTDSKVQLMELFKQPGVVFHSRVGQTEIIEEMLQSRFYLYLCNKDVHETDCIAIREAQYCGCTPITLDLGVFKERPGIRLPPLQSNRAQQIIDLLQSEPTSLPQTEELSWRDVAVHWLAVVS